MADRDPTTVLGKGAAVALAVAVPPMFVALGVPVAGAALPNVVVPQPATNNAISVTKHPSAVERMCA